MLNPGGSGGAVLDRALGNLGNQHPLARLKALHEVEPVLLDGLKAMFFKAKLAQVQTARSAGASWGKIGAAEGISHKQARLRYHDHL